MRKRVAEYSDTLPVSKIDLGSTARLPGDYAAGHPLGVTYELSKPPDEPKLRADLQTIVRAYRALTYRGGIDADVDSQSEVAEEFGMFRAAAALAFPLLRYTPLPGLGRELQNFPVRAAGDAGDVVGPNGQRVFHVAGISTAIVHTGHTGLVTADVV